VFVNLPTQVLQKNITDAVASTDQSLPIEQTHLSQSAVGCERRLFSTNAATRGVLARIESSKSFFAGGSAPDPAGGAYDAPTNPLVGWEVDTPSPFPHRLGRLDLATPSASQVRRSPCVPGMAALLARLRYYTHVRTHRRTT